MKILWIEDFGAGDKSKKNPEPEELAKSIFQSILSDHKSIFDGIEEDLPFEEQFSELVKKHSIHEIVLCKNYKAWNEKIKDNFDFDIALIDINLEEGSSQVDIPPNFGTDFHKKAGFYIYLEILKLGVPDDNIAFFTAETKSISDFQKSCTENSIPLPENVFEKKDEDYKRLGEWLRKNSDLPYLILRRAIIDSNSGIMKIFKDKEDIIFNKTLYKDKNGIINPLTINDIQRYLEKLKHFFPLNPPFNKEVKYYSFVKELSDLWERSQGYLKKKDVGFSDVEYNFKNFCQNQMKLLRNWTAHNQFSDGLTEKELAFYFIIAIRALLKLDLNKVYRYEKILFSLFENEKIDLLIETEIKKELAKSYYQVRNIFEKSVFNIENPNYNAFNDLLKNLGGATTKRYLHLKGKFTKVLISNSVKWFYQNLFHGIYLDEFNVYNPAGKDLVEINIKFDVKKLNEMNFLDELEKSIYYLSFG